MSSTELNGGTAGTILSDSSRRDALQRPWGVGLSIAWIVLAFAAEGPARDALRAAGLTGLAGHGAIANALDRLSVWGLVFAVVLVAVRLSAVPAHDYFGWARPRGRDVLAGAGLMVALYTALVLMTLAGDPSVHIAAVRRAEAAGVSPVWLVLAWWPTFFLAPVVEESLFRGFLWRGVETRHGPIAALMVTTAIFTAFHYGYFIGRNGVDAAVVLQYLVGGAILGGLRWTSGGTVVPMVAHMINNLALSAFPVILAVLTR